MSHTLDEVLKDPKVLEILNTINSTPEIMSALYDLGMLPEQTMRDPHLFPVTLAFAKVHRRVLDLEAGIIRHRNASCAEDDVDMGAEDRALHGLVTPKDVEPEQEPV